MIPRKIIGLAAALFLTACGEDPNAPYLNFAGGGFVFNYRNAEAFYGFVAKPVRTLPEGGSIEAQFEVPALRWADLGDAQQGPKLLQDAVGLRDRVGDRGLALLCRAAGAQGFFQAGAQMRQRRAQIVRDVVAG